MAPVVLPRLKTYRTQKRPLRIFEFSLKSSWEPSPPSRQASLPFSLALVLGQEWEQAWIVR